MNKIQVTAQQRANAIEARDVTWPSVPEANVSPHLDWWRGPRGLGNATSPPDCGTIACFGGWCAWWPPFRAQGITASKTSGAPLSGAGGLADHQLFGIGGLFVPSTGHEADDHFVGTDHALVLNRLNWLIENSEVIA